MGEDPSGLTAACGRLRNSKGSNGGAVQWFRRWAHIPETAGSTPAPATFLYLSHIMIPAVPRTVLYTLSAADANAVNHRRNASNVKGIGNHAKEGDVFPLMIVRVWGNQPDSAFNGQVLLDGSDSLWVTSTSFTETPTPGKAHVPPRVEDPSASSTRNAVSTPDIAAVSGSGQLDR